jgi:hypothetical protein
MCPLSELASELNETQRLLILLRSENKPKEKNMSVWKETWFELDEILNKQHKVDSTGAGMGLVVEGRTDHFRSQAIADAVAVKALRGFIAENLDSEHATIRTSDDFVKGGTTGTWKFTLEMLEGIEDGRKYGAVAEVILWQTKTVNYLTLTMRNAE